MKIKSVKESCTIKSQQINCGEGSLQDTCALHVQGFRDKGLLSLWASSSISETCGSLVAASKWSGTKSLAEKYVDIQQNANILVLVNAAERGLF